MSRFTCGRAVLGFLLVLGVVAAVVVGTASCGMAPSAVFVSGPSGTANEPPTLTFQEPRDHVTKGRGDFFLIRWTDTDRDSSAVIGFRLINTASNNVITLVEGIAEDDTVGPDSFTVGTSLIPVGSYNLLAIIADDDNPPIEVFAMTGETTVEQRVVVRIVEQGTAPPTVPPIVYVTEPGINLSVAQDDSLRVSVQPSALQPDPGNPVPFDPDSPITLYILLDLDQDPNNDDPSNPDPSNIILLRQQVITQEAFQPIDFDVDIDLAVVQPRPGGLPYYIRATVDDGTNPRVHQYAVGTISIVELASGTVDLAEIGKTKAGATFYGFNPGANVGSRASSIGDFDADGVADFVLVAQFGNPRNFGLVGEAYIIYGRDQVRFGGAIPVNSVSESVSGVILEAPPVREIWGGRYLVHGDPVSDGITDVGFVRDLNADGRPELLFGLPRVFGAFEAMDFDFSDEALDADEATVDVEIIIRAGSVTVLVDDSIVSVASYNGTQDVIISSEFPNANFGSDASLSWRDAGEGQREWTLIKFADLINPSNPIIPDTVATLDITTVDATLELRVFDTGGDGTVHTVLTDFSEQTTYATFAGGADPQPNVNYEVLDENNAGLGTVAGDSADTVDIDVSDTVQRLLDGLLGNVNNEIRFIIVPDADEGDDRTSARSSEFSDFNRPVLRIQYTRLGTPGSLGCFPDPYVNNQTTADPDFDLKTYAGGMAVIINSTNRDNDPAIENTQRLESTVVTLELVGQESWVLGTDGTDDSGGGIFVRADNSTADVIGNDPEQEGRIAGARVTAGWYDAVDHLNLAQPARDGKFGQSVSSLGDLNNDGLDEIIISAPNNERYLQDAFDRNGFQSTHFQSTGFEGSIVVIPGANYNDNFWREKNDDADASAVIPVQDQWRLSPPFGRCSAPADPRHGPLIPADSFMVFAEDIDDQLGDGQSAGDFNQDGLDDILCGAPRNARASADDTGASYILYGRNVLGNFDLKNADHPLLRTPMLRVRGVNPGDRIGWIQATGLDVNGDRVDDVFISSPYTDFGPINRSSCAADFNGDDKVDSQDLDRVSFNNCRDQFDDIAEDLFSDDACKAFDYNNDGEIDTVDEEVFNCLTEGTGNCCENLVDNGFVGVIFGGVFIDGDRDITQIGTPDLPGTRFYGSGPGNRAGMDVSSAGDFNQDGFGDILITVPGETRVDIAGRERLGVVYLVFGGTHLFNTEWNLSLVGTEDLPGIVFLSPYVKGRPNEAPPRTVAFLGDINNDGFGDIVIGNPMADFIDLTFPQGPDSPGSDAEVGRRRNAGDAYIVYGNNFGSNRGAP